MKKATVTQAADGINIAFSAQVAKQEVVGMVEHCQSGGCTCMNDADKAKIAAMEVSGEDGDVTLHLKSEGLEAETIEKALENSPLNG